MASRPSQQASLEWLSREYHDLNGSHIDVLENPPTALEFARIVHISRPVLIRGFKIPASTSKWSNDYLINKMGSLPVSVAVTPNGRADAVTPGLDGKLFFAEPAVETMTMKFLLDNLSDDDAHAETFYLQSQNGNVYSSRFFQGQDDPSEFAPLRQDIPSDVKWCTEALDRAPEAVNLWIGNGKSVSSIHSDPFENIYHVVRGTKYFTLLPPMDGFWLDERLYPHATYVRNGKGGDLTLQPSSDTPSVRWASISDHLSRRLPQEAHPIHLSVGVGETLYLPPGWFHEVRQAECGITIALNWWYDTCMQGHSWVLLSYLRAIKDVPLGNAEDDSDETMY
ncbi:Clavaminate synthase-like protein [Gymnopus androsaceus JB14]|uniref:Clavaminate synthase-like protein n=1 Tax=Gymnopus androsaceus JB14 TaxID=1447944 RepID=A0A6A4IE28_9AGAR|nr:Clavaminate synthase-like protein [Gymnopus androsaceus JB14]